MKTFKTLIAALLISASAFAQNVGINSDGTAPDGSAMLDVSSTTKGFLVPRVVSTANVPSPATGLLVYQTGGTAGFYYYTGTAWTLLGTGSGNGTVTSVATGTGLTGGPVTTTGTISLTNTSVTAGSYTRATITVDAQGRITAAGDGSAVSLTSGVSGTLPLTSGGTGATDAAGARTNLGLGTAALANTGTAASNIPVLDGSGKIPNSLLTISGGLAYKGNKSLSGNPVVTVETSGNYYIISVAGTETGSGLTFAVGDWMISNGTAWQNISNSSAVTSVAGKAGAVTLSGADITSGTVAIANGGTGASTAADARISLGMGTAALVNTGTSSGNVPVLDGTGKIPSSLLNISGMSYKGNKSLSGNPTVSVETSGNYYIVSVAGKESGSNLTFAAGDWMISNGTAWQLISNSSAVTSVAGKTGAVILTGADIASGTVAVANGGTGTTTGSITGTSALTFAAGGTNQNVTITPSGTGYTLLNSNVGIGTTTPLSKLQVYGTETGANWAGMGAFGGASSAVVLGQYNNKAYLGAHNAAFSTWVDLLINPGGGNVGIGTITPGYKLDVYASVNSTYAAQILNNSSAGSGLSVIAGGNPGNGSNKILSLKDGGSNEKFTVLDNGKVGIGTTTPSQKLDVAGNIKITNQSGPVAAPDKIDLGTSYSNGASRDQCKIYLYDAGGNQKFGFGIGANADIQYHSYQAHDFYVDNSKRFSVTVSGGANSSDRRLKRDILPLNKYGLQQVMQLNPVTYIFKDDSKNTPQVGFIAQEVQQIIPEVVTGKEGDLSKGESLGIVYGNLVPVLTKAIQEQQAEIEALKAENAAMKAENTSMKAKVESIDNLKAENTSMKADLEALKSAVYGAAQIKQQ